MKYKVQLGEEFEVDVASFSERVPVNPTNLEEAKNRRYVLIIVLVVAGVFLFGAAVLGVTSGNLQYIQSVYNVASVPCLLIIGYYFGTGRDR